MKVLVAGGGGFIGGHLVQRLISEGHEVRVVDIKPVDEWWQLHESSENTSADLLLKEAAEVAVRGVDWIFNLAADMGGMGFIEANKALCMLSTLINTHLLQASVAAGVSRYFYASSACVYASWHQDDTNSTSLKESDAYPADPEDGYGWEKLFAERMCRHFHEDFGLQVRIGRFHNVYGPKGTYVGGREKAPAAACRKMADLERGALSNIEIWGDGHQIRSFTYVDDCVEGIIRLMESDFSEPLNIGSDEAVTIRYLYDQVAKIANVMSPSYQFVLDAPLGVRGRSSDNTLCRSVLGWEPQVTLADGLVPTYRWVANEVRASNAKQT